MSWVYDEDGCYRQEPDVIEPAEPIPEIPPECWNDRPISGVTCMEAVRSLCGGR